MTNEHNETLDDKISTYPNKRYTIDYPNLCEERRKNLMKSLASAINKLSNDNEVFKVTAETCGYDTMLCDEINDGIRLFGQGLAALYDWDNEED